MDSAPLALILPKSDFAEAVRYIRNHWETLNAYTRDDRVPIDNNAVEQFMKQVSLGRKACLSWGPSVGAVRVLRLLLGLRELGQLVDRPDPRSARSEKRMSHAALLKELLRRRLIQLHREGHETTRRKLE